MKRRFEDFNAQDLANTAWAYATVTQSDVPMLERWAIIAENRFGDF